MLLSLHRVDVLFWEKKALANATLQIYLRGSLWPGCLCWWNLRIFMLQGSVYRRHPTPEHGRLFLYVRSREIDEIGIFKCRFGSCLTIGSLPRNRGCRFGILRVCTIAENSSGRALTDFCMQKKWLAALCPEANEIYSPLFAIGNATHGELCRILIGLIQPPHQNLELFTLYVQARWTQSL